MTARIAISVVGLVGFWAATAAAQPYGQPDRGMPGDEMIQGYLARETAKLAGQYEADVKSLADWQAMRPEYLEQYYYMLGLSPRPEKTPLNPQVTGTLKAEGCQIDLFHYQSRPGLYVTGNLYRPAEVKPGEKLPAVFYVCGHSQRGRNGNKVAYQSHGLWFARHGYICLVVDSLQLGEIAATHHGTYNLNRWWWHSRGYTPAGVEAWNGIRGIDYLCSREDVDSQRIAVTGISGGGAATFWIAAADERVKVAVPVSGMADLESYVPNRVINGHCDCMFLYNTFQWPWTRIANLVAPRPMLFVNSDKDAIFPMDANERIITRLERLYSLHGAGGDVDAVVSVGGHAYRQDIRRAVYQFINAHLKGDARPVTDSEVDIVSEGRDPGPYPIEPEKLRVFPTDADLPRDEINTKIDESFVPLAKPDPPKSGEFDAWKAAMRKELRRVSFRYFPEAIPAAERRRNAIAYRPDQPRLPRIAQPRVGLTSEEGIVLAIKHAGERPDARKNVLLAVITEDEWGTTPDWIKTLTAPDQMVVICEPRGIGETRWTRKNGPNYVERSHVLLGRTVDTGRVWDVIAAYAAALDDSIAGVTVIDPPPSHMENAAPQFLNVLRVCDIPDALGLIAPRPLTIVGGQAEKFAATTAAYTAAGAKDKLTFKPQ